MSKLVLGRKVGQSVVIQHAGEELIVTLEEHNGSGRAISFEGPRSFRLMRAELIGRGSSESDIGHSASEHNGADCFVECSETNRKMKGVVLSGRDDPTEGRKYDIRTTDNTLWRNYSADLVTIVDKAEDVVLPE